MLDKDELFEAASSVSNLNSSFTFKLSETMKQDFVDKCNERGLGTGKTLRFMVEKFLEEKL
jgi:hypothetical protein